MFSRRALTCGTRAFSRSALQPLNALSLAGRTAATQTAAVPIAPITSATLFTVSACAPVSLLSISSLRSAAASAKPFFLHARLSADVASSPASLASLTSVSVRPLSTAAAAAVAPATATAAPAAASASTAEAVADAAVAEAAAVPAAAAAAAPTNTAAPAASAAAMPTPLVFPPGASLSERARLFWLWYSQPVPSHPRWSPAWYREMAYLCVVFSITGSSALYVVRGLLATVGVSASLFHGDALHRLLYLALMMPSYSAMMLLVGTLMGRHAFARFMVTRMWGRFGRIRKLFP